MKKKMDSKKKTELLWTHRVNSIFFSESEVQTLSKTSGIAMESVTQKVLMPDSDKRPHLFTYFLRYLTGNCCGKYEIINKYKTA